MNENIATVRAIHDRKREQLRDRMDRKNMATTGTATVLDDFLDLSSDYVDFEFSYAGLNVHFYFFLDVKKGVITVDSTFFESFELVPDSWDTIIPEALVTFINAGAYNYMGNDVNESDIVEIPLRHDDAMIAWITPSPSMKMKPVTRLLTCDGGKIPVIVKLSVIESIQGRMDWFTPSELRGIIIAVHWRRFLGKTMPT